MVTSVLGGAIAATLANAALTLNIAFSAAAACHLAVACLSILAILKTRPEAPPLKRLPAYPRWTVLCALHDEAAVVGQLIRRLSQLDYPPDRLEAFLLLEEHDVATLRAAEAAYRPPWLRIVLVPPGSPQTKPRALNYGLERATGEFVTVYDAEDEPHPHQLREAAARFLGDDTGRLSCLQSPLRIRRRHRSATPSRFIDRQFAAEYAALFEAKLPGLAALGLPFPLGGTSNHVRVCALRDVGGWDPFNVTEDADLGFRLWSAGHRSGTLWLPTWETPPGPIFTWLPQRTRWLKGYMQTFGVHTRRPWRLGARGLAALLLTLGASLAAAATHGPSLLWLAAAGLMAVHDRIAPAIPLWGLGVLGIGVVTAWAKCWIGARRAGVPFGVTDMLAAPIYWSLFSLAFCHAAIRLAAQPFVWDKTDHRPDTPDGLPELHFGPLDAAGGERLSAGHAVASEALA